MSTNGLSIHTKSDMNMTVASVVSAAFTVFAPPYRYTYIRNVLDAWSTSATVRTVPGGTPEDKGSPSPGKVPLGLKDTGVPLDGRSPYLPICSHPSQLLVSDEQLRGLAGAMPPRYRHSKWTLLYRYPQVAIYTNMCLECSVGSIRSREAAHT